MCGLASWPTTLAITLGGACSEHSHSLASLELQFDSVCQLLFANWAPSWSCDDVHVLSDDRYA